MTCSREGHMQIPGLKELETSVGRAAEELSRLKTENAELAALLRAVGKETNDLADLIKALETGQKIDAKTKKKLQQKLKSMTEKLT